MTERTFHIETTLAEEQNDEKGSEYRDLAARMDPERRVRAETKAYIELIERDLELIADIPGAELTVALSGLTLEELIAMHESTQRILRGKSN